MPVLPISYLRTVVINLGMGCSHMEEMLTWLYGRSARNSHIRKMAEKAILILKEKPMEYLALCRELGIDFDQYQKPKRTFYFVVNPLKSVKLITEQRQIVSQKPKRYKTVYFLDPGRFQGYMMRVVEESAERMKSE